MYWPASGKTAGYEKGKYSLALPAGVACIGLVSLIVGLITSVGFPNVVRDWTKNHMCIMGPWQKEYTTWTQDSDRQVTVTVYFWNLDNGEQFLMNQAVPQFSLVGPFGFNETNKRFNVVFDNGEVSFTKSTTYTYYNVTDMEDYGSISTNTNQNITMPHRPFLQRYTEETKVRKYFQTITSKISDVFRVFGVSTNEIKPWLLSALNGSCQNLSSYHMVQTCQLLHTPFSELSLTQRLQSVTLAMSILEELLAFNKLTQLISGDVLCTNLCEQFSSLLKYQTLYHFCKTQNVRFVLTTCQNKNRTILRYGDTIEDQVTNLDIMDRLIFTTFNVFVNAKLNTMPVNFLLGTEANDFLGSIFDDRSSYKLSLCVDKWNIDSSTVFQWLEINDYAFPKNIYSEYSLPPAERVAPCLSPQPRKLFSTMFDGLKTPVHFLYQRTAKLNSQTVHVYSTVHKRLPFAQEVELSNVGYNTPLIITHMCGNRQMRSSLNICSNVTLVYRSIEMWVEPVTGAVWHFDVNYQLNAKLPDEYFVLYNISNIYRDRLFPLMWIRRTAEVSSTGQGYFLNTIKPFLMATCGATVVFNSLAVGLVLLAAYLVIRLHWKPLKSHRFEAQMESLDFQQLNTVKLRKMLGN